MHEIARRALEGTEPIRVLVEEFYGPRGPLVQQGWDVRPQQVEMSLDIADQLAAYASAPDRDPDTGQYMQRPPQWGFVEAPCGTGKGAAYGVPGVLAALRAEREFTEARAAAIKAGTPAPTEPRKLIVTTANIALQEQLVRKDFPALAAMLGVEDRLRVVLMKSRANYLCRAKVRALGGELIGDPRVARLVRWMDAAECDGDKESLDHDPGEVWNDVSATTDDCIATACPHYAPKEGEAQLCYWRQAIAGYQHAHVVVTNHHFLAVSRGLRACLLAVDEAHELEDSLRATQARALTPYTGRPLSKRLEAVATADETSAVVDMPVRWLMDRAAQYLGQQAPTFGTQPPDTCKLLPGWLGEADERTAENYAVAMRRLLVATERACTEAGCTRLDRIMLPPRFSRQLDAERAGKLGKSWEQLLGLVERYEAIVRVAPCEEWPAADSPWAFYLERVKSRRGEDRTIAQLAPADVSWATAALAQRYPVACFTTATMPAFKPQRVALGLGTDPHGAPAPRYEKRLPSPYRLAEQGVLVVPHGPRPNDAGWSEWATEQVVRTVTMARGGTLVLASSTKQMRAYAEALRHAAASQPWDVRMQGETGRAELRRWFGQDVDGVLVATRSFFQGLDVQGDACRCVIIDRIPFARPDDPVEEAVGKLLVSRAGAGATAYMLRSVPGAAMVLAQGAGRLIRAHTDLGAVVLLDTRVLQPGEGWQAMRAGLPAFPLSRDVDDIRRRLDKEPLRGMGQPVAGRVVRRSA